MRISTKRAKKLRRGIVSGRILAEQLESLSCEMPENTFGFWAALRIRAYISETESFAESEALYYTVLPTLRRLVSNEELRRIMHYSLILKRDP